MSKPFSFQLFKTDGDARRGEFIASHGKVQTPAFMPVGTQATVKGLMPDDVRATGAEIVLGNTYHLMLRPGAERIAALGGLHKFMNWPLPILTDSGGFQVMSLSELRQIDERGVTFRSHLDGAMVALSPERAIEIQGLLGADISMQLDECLKLPASSRGNRARDAAVVALGRALETRFRGACEARLCPVRDRAGRRRSRAARRERPCAYRHGFPGLCDRRTCGRRAAGGDAQDRGRDGAGAAGGPPALSDGCRHAARSHRSREARHRHVRLRVADAQRPPRHGLHAFRSDQSRQRTPRERSAAARRGERASGRAHLFARLSASPDQGQRDTRRGVALDHQSCLLPDARWPACARRSRPGALPNFRPPRRPAGRRAICQPL